MAELRCRRASPADSDAIARLHHASHAISFRPFAPAQWVASRDVAAYERDWRARLLTPGAGASAFVATEGEDIVAIASASPARRSGELAPGVEVRSMHVEPRRLGHGIGRALWAFVGRSLREAGYTRARLDVIAANVRARRFFEAAGARVVAASPAGVEGVPIVTYEIDLCPRVGDPGR